MPLDDIRDGRVAKRAHLLASHQDPYPARTSRTHTIRAVLDSFDSLSAEATPLVLAGRVMARREHGGAMFLDLMDASGTIQLHATRDALGDEVYALLTETLDIGDIIEASGTVFVTKRGERTLEVRGARMLTKTLLPLPEKWHGLQDVEERYRKRYLDILLNTEVREKMVMRSRIVQAMRSFMQSHGFIEVQTPTLQPLYGGASARPFKTHMHALDIDLYLRIAPELYLKRLLVAGFERVCEFTTNFRNEGIDRDHNPEFSAMEFYAAFQDLDWAMTFTEDLMAHVLESLQLGTTTNYQGTTVHWMRPFVRATFFELLKEHTGVSYLEASEDDMRAVAKKLGVVIEKHVTKPGIADELFKKVVRPKLIEPTFVIEYPVELLPLAKRIPERPEVVSAFQFYAGGLELIKAFTELNDPIDQRERFAGQETQRAKGDEEAQRLDEDFIQALEYGMPPAAGWGIGLDRFVALLTDSHALREVILFPLMKPHENE
ncbi:MAG: lysine--tRNA ligase [Candidatus Paceibacterota bacterium]|nr:MAG: lysine--tRNA ligase [Candidatus Paceibacterota bacterium]